jgi:hypothetical protein
MADGVSYEVPDSALVQKAIEVLRSRLRKRGIAIYVSGIDGSGKTTLAQTLVETLEASGMEARHLHVYQWYLNIVWTPILLLHNRYVGRKILVLDRGIYDNFSVLVARHPFLERISRSAMSAMVALYPRFDYLFYLFAAFPEIIRRRPDTCETRYTTLSRIYDAVASRARCVRLHSDRRLFGAALHDIAG